MNGPDRLRRDLSALKARLARRVLPAALRGGAEVLAAEVRRRCPEDSGAMRDSVAVAGGTDRRGNPSAEVVVPGGPGEDVLAVEFGTAHQAPDPFVRRSLAAKKSEAIARVRDDVASGLGRSSG